MANTDGDAPIQPIEPPKTRKEPKNQAAEMLKRKVLRDARKKQEELAQGNANNQYFLKCPRVANHMAAFLTENPVGFITPGMWHSLLHAVGAPWNKPFIPCQECFVEGEERAWQAHVRPIAREDNSFDFAISTERKHAIGSCPKEELELRKTSLHEATKAEGAI